MRALKAQGGASRSAVIGVVAVVAVAVLLFLMGEDGPLAPVEAPDATGTAAPPVPAVAMVDDARIANVETDEPGAWLTYGRTYEEQRFSPLTQVNRDNVADLGIAWYRDFGTLHPVEATPLVVDGVMYATTPWNITYALDAATGEEVWSYDPEVPGETARKACCGVISRGLAVYRGRVYVATLDGRLIALDAASGAEVWEVDTVIDRSRNYTITGAPRAAAGKVYIGNGGAEFGVRGYVTAYDAGTGAQAWRFFTVPGDPSLPFEHPEMEMAAKTWKGGEWWEIGGGGTVWNSIVYDPDFNYVYLGVGNGSPWTRVIRSPGGGDNLFLAAIVAVDADTGVMKWYYQTTPGDNWDYTAVQDMTLADLEVDGEMRKVLMQAPKNGFFYVIDRSDGKLLRAHRYGTVTWATHVDLDTGRPVENPGVAYDENPQFVHPGAAGAHNWHAMSWDGARGLMYLTTHDLPFLYAMPEEYQKTGVYKRRAGMANLGVEYGRLNQLLEAWQDPPEPEGFLIAFDPLSGETAWAVEQEQAWNGGVVATAAGLVFQGDAMGKVSARSTDDGSLLWQQDTWTSIVGPTMTYEVDGVQYVAVMTGAGSINVADTATHRYGSHARVVVFALGGDVELPVPPERDWTIGAQPPVTASAADIDRGDILYHELCSGCHGIGLVSAGAIPDLRLMSAETHGTFEAIVLGGTLNDNGMASFADVLDAADADRIHQYVITRANKAREEALEKAGEAAGQT